MSSTTKWAFGAAAVLAAGAGYWLGGRQPELPTLTFVNVGQGDCAALQSGGHALLIDVGPRVGHLDAGAKIIVPSLRKAGVFSVDLVLISHPDLDHVGGLASVIRAFPNARVGISASFRDDEHMLQTLSDAKIPASQVTWLQSKATLEFAHLPIRIEDPPRGYKGHDNDGSMFVQIGGPGGATFSGDAPSKIEEAELPKEDWKCEVLKCGHHGSRSSTGDAWLNETQPRFGILSVGANNHYGHPAPEVLERLTNHGVRPLRTDREGDLRFQFVNGKFVRLP